MSVNLLCYFFFFFWGGSGVSRGGGYPPHFFFVDVIDYSIFPPPPEGWERRAATLDSSIPAVPKHGLRRAAGRQAQALEGEARSRGGLIALLVGAAWVGVVAAVTQHSSRLCVGYGWSPRYCRSFLDRWGAVLYLVSVVRRLRVGSSLLSFIP